MIKRGLLVSEGCKHSNSRELGNRTEEHKRRTIFHKQLEYSTKINSIALYFNFKKKQIKNKKLILLR